MLTPVTLDYETYWSTTFSLSKISFVEYIQSPEFEVISVSVKIGNADTVVRFGPEVAPYLQSIDWSDKIAVAHNGNEFDFPVLVWTHGCHPKLFADTLCMARPKHQSEVGGSLKKLSERYGLPAKDNGILMATKGKRYADLNAEELRDMAQYNKVDTDNTYQLFRALLKDTPSKELLLSDMTARMICYPQLVADTDLLDRTLSTAEDIKHQQLTALIDTLGVLTVEDVRATLASAPRFAGALRAYGVEPPLKISKTTGKETLALAKTDEEFTALLDHEDERVQLITATRLGVKSTLLETRLHKMSTCAKLMQGWMPVPLGYHSATTGRWGGRVWNPQNLPRIPRDKQGVPIPRLANALRDALCAPEGYQVVVSDLSGIELRVNHYLWDVDSTRELYAADPEADLYKEFAAALFGIERSQVTKDQRQLAKVAQLGLGFGAGAATFKKVAKIMGNIELPDDEALRVTQAWRAKYSDIVTGWRQCQKLIDALYRGNEFSPDPRGLVRSDKGSVLLPSGRRLYYPDLVSERDEKTGKAQYHYGTGRNRSKVYSGLLDENLVQAIARDVIAEQALTIQLRTGYYPALTVHDELVYVVPEAQAQDHLREINHVMRTSPTWLPGIVLWSEGDIAYNYGSAK